MEEEKNYTVYMHICPNGKKYVGITNKNPQRRWRNGGYGYKTQPFYNAIIHYGWENIEHKILLQNLTQEDAQFKEMEYIQKYNSLFPNGWNFTEGGEYNVLSQFSKNKLSNTQIERFKDEKNKKHLYKKVFCDNKIFKSIDDFKIYYKISKYSHVGEWLNGTRKMPKKWFDKGLKFYGQNLNISCSNFCHKNCIILCDGKYFNGLKDVSLYLNIPRTTICGWLNGNNKIPFYYYQRGLCYYGEFNKLNITYLGKKGQIKVVCENIVFNSITDLGFYYYKHKDSKFNKYLNGSKPMPQKWKDKGLRYYNEETDKDLPIWNEKGDINE